MSLDLNKQELYIDCNVFLEEFRISYYREARPILKGKARSSLTNRKLIQQHLDEINKIYSRESLKHFNGISKTMLDKSVILNKRRAQVPTFMFPSTAMSNASPGLPFKPIVQSSSFVTTSSGIKNR